MKISIEISPDELKIMKSQTKDVKNNITWDDIAEMCKDGEKMFKSFIENLENPCDYKPKYIPRKKIE